MRISGILAAAVLAVIAALGLSACSAPADASGKPAVSPGKGVFTVVVDGSSTTFPISEVAAAGFQRELRGRARVTVAESGTGGGFRKFCRGETDVQGASRPILAKEIDACAKAGVTFVEVPIAFDALSVVVNPSNPVKTITVEELKKVWEPDAQAKVMNWNQVNPAFPDLPLTLYGPGTASGTFDYFTEAVVGRAKASRSDYTPSEDDNVLVQGVSGDRGALGYFGLAYYLENKSKVRALAVDAGKGGVYPSVAAVKAGDYKPLARPIFIYFRQESLAKKPVMAFALHYLEHAEKYAEAVDYVPLPPEAYAVYIERVKTGQIGTVFGGKQDIGADIKEVLSRPLAKTLPAEPAPEAPR